MSGLAIDFGRVSEKNGALLVWNALCGLFDVVGAIEVGVIDPSQVDATTTALDCHRFVHQHLDVHPLKIRQHQNRVVIAENTINRVAQLLAKGRKIGQTSIKLSICLTSKVARENADIPNYAADKLPHAGHRGRAHVAM